ncbi:MAG: HAMP domain-containing sensor histidine kinase, partial [Nitriliruptoraceae bacterium]
LVRDLLDLARIEHDDEMTTTRRQRIDIGEMVRTQLERLRGPADDMGVTLSANVPDVATVVGNPTDVRQIVVNLLENAVQYNRPGGTVTVEVARAPESLTLWVRDTGVGIPRDATDRVFERFYRVDKARSRLAGGTGLGLSIVRHAVESHGGTIRIESEVDRGTTVTVTLPVASDA